MRNVFPLVCPGHSYVRKCRSGQMMILSPAGVGGCRSGRGDFNAGTLSGVF